MRRLSVRPLEAATFTPWGSVFDAPEGAGLVVNQGRGRRFDLTGLPEPTPVTSHPANAMFRLEPVMLPFTLTVMERHPFSPQLFLPLDVSRYLVACAPDRDGAPDLDGLVAYTGRGGQALLYRTLVWHAPLAVLDREALFFMRIAETGSGGDTVLVDVEPTLIEAMH